MNLLLDLQINNTVFQNVHQSFIKYIKHTEVINIHFFYKSKNTSFLKRTDLSQKGSFIRNKCFYSTFSKNACTTKKDFLFFHYILYRVFLLHLWILIFYNTLLISLDVFFADLKTINDSFQTNIKYLKYKEYLNLLLFL